MDENFDKPTNESFSGEQSNMEKIEKLVTKYEQNVYNLALHLTNDEDRSEKILLEVIAGAADKVATAPALSAEDFAASIYQAAIGQAVEPATPLDQSVTKIIEKIYTGSEPSAEAGARGSSEVEEAMNRLPLEYKLVFWLRDVAGLSFNEIGEALELSIDEVRARLHRARLMVRRQVIKTSGTVSAVEAPVEFIRTVPQSLML
jgi:RNA polymerase sigma factor (sigma-70 family)